MGGVGRTGKQLAFDWLRLATMSAGALIWASDAASAQDANVWLETIVVSGEREAPATRETATGPVQGLHRHAKGDHKGRPYGQSATIERNHFMESVV